MRGSERVRGRNTSGRRGEWHARFGRYDETGRKEWRKRNANSSRQWWSEQDSVTFYFTNFPDDYMLKDMWGVFQQWGKVCDVYIPNRRDKSGRRYGFVRFTEVRDLVDLALRLDHVVIGSTKVRVNSPRFDRDGKRRFKETQGSSSNTANPAAKRTAPVKYAGSDRSYAQVLRPVHPLDDGGGRDTVNGLMPTVVTEAPVTTMELEAPVAGWLASSWVGRVHDVAVLEHLQGTFEVEGFTSVMVRHMGDDMVLLTATGALGLPDMFREVKQRE